MEAKRRPAAGRPGDGLLRSASACLWGVGPDGLPERLENDDRVRLSARRLLEASAELCDAMDGLQRESLHRPAHALLRALLESIAYSVWLSADPAKHGTSLREATTPPLSPCARTDRLGGGVPTHVPIIVRVRASN